MAVQVSFINLNCRDCTEQEKLFRGCEKESEAGFFSFHGEDIRRCPLKLITAQSRAYLNAYHLYEKNILPHGTGWIYESKKFLDAMSIINREIIQIREEQTKKARRGKRK